MKLINTAVLVGKVLLIFALAIRAYSASHETPLDVSISVEYGTVMETFPFTVNTYHSGRSMALGANLGELVGTVAASRHWGMTCYAVEPMIGATAGRAMGMMMENAINANRLEQIYVALEDGLEVIVTQPSTKRKFKTGDEVKVLRYSGTFRVVYHKDEYVELEENPYLEMEAGNL